MLSTYSGPGIPQTLPHLILLTFLQGIIISIPQMEKLEEQQNLMKTQTHTAKELQSWYCREGTSPLTRGLLRSYNNDKITMIKIVIIHWAFTVHQISALLSTFQTLTYLILTTNAGGKCYYYIHFTDEGTKTQRW